MTPREALAAKLLPYLSPTEGRGVVELLALAGIPRGRGVAQSAAVALGDLLHQGLARRSGDIQKPVFFAAPAHAPVPAEQVELPELDATLTFTSKVERPFGAPTDRTTVAVTCALGPSWPEGTRVPGWSTSLFAAQVAAGGLAGARSAGLARLTEMLTTLRYASPTHDFLPPPEVPVTDRDTISDLLAYCAGVSGGAKDSSVHSWLKARRLSRIRAEELLEQLVHEGRLRVVERPIAGGEVVVRYLPADPSTRPAPLPVSDAPAEEPPAEAVEEPTLIGAVEEPPVCAWCEQRKADPEQGALEDQLDQARAHAARCEAERDALARERDALARERDAIRAELGAGLGDALQRTADLAREVMTLRQERDLARGEIFGMRAELARSQAPTLDQGAIAHYLLSLPGDRWEALATARQQLAQAREMAHAARLLEEAALAAVDGLLDTPAKAPAPAPAPELAPAPPSAPPPPPPPPPAPEAVISAPWQGDTGEAPGTMRDRVLRAFLSQPQREMRAADLADELEVERHDVTAPLSLLTADKKLERVGRGLYRLAKKLARRAA